MPRRPSALLDTRIIYCGDCLDQLRKLPDACVDLIYLDPPFNSNRNYEVFWGETKEKRAFEDRHESTQAYIEFMRPRCVEMARVLKKTGSFYYHCDWHASHYVKVMLDQIMGENNFQGEIIWKRTSAHGDAKRQWGAVHDSIFFYSASNDYTFHQQYGAYDEAYVAGKYRYQEPDGRRYRLSDLRSPQPRPNLIYDYKGYKPHPNGWAVSRERMAELDAQGLLRFPAKPTGRIEMKRYLDERKGMPAGNVWLDIDPINSQAVERLGYPTQKPVALLERIVQASSNEGDIVLDAFCGCGTALVAAQKLKRQWIGIDISPTACRVMAKRLVKDCGLPENEKLWQVGRGFVVRDLPWTEDKLRKIPPFEFENWAVIALGGIGNKAKVGDMGIDGRIYPVSSIESKRGGDVERERKAEARSLAFMDAWFPIQVKQKDKVGRPDVDAFEAVMMREERDRGYFVSFDYSSDAVKECDAFYRRTKKVIKLLTVREILDDQLARLM